MKRVLYIWLVLFLHGFMTHGQEPVKVDSLINILNDEIDANQKVNILNTIAEEYLYIDHEKIYDYAQQALELSKKEEYSKGVAMSYNNLGTYYRVKGIYDESMDYFFDALEIMEELEDIEGIGRCYNLIGILYFFLENFDLSLDYYLKALEINHQQNDLKWIAGNSNNVGMIYERKNEYEKALEFYMKSLEMNTELGYKNWIANNYGNIGSLYQLMDNPESLGWFKKRLRLKEEQNDTDGIALSNYLIGNYYVQEKRPDDAIVFLAKAHELALISSSLSILSRSTNKLSESYSLIGDFYRALQFEKLNKIYEDSLNLSSSTEKITRLQMQYEYKKNQQITTISFEKSKLIQTLVASGLLFILFLVVLIYSGLRIKTRKQNLEQDKLVIGNKLLHEELEFKEKMLQDNIKYLLSINHLLTNTIDRFNNLISSSQPENQKIIKEIINNLQSGVNDDIWEEFELRFNQIHKDFYQQLNTLYPDLSPNDKKLCAFLKLNMTTREISAITSLSKKSIETARSRLRKKLNIPEKTTSLSEFLNKI